MAAARDRGAAVVVAGDDVGRRSTGLLPAASRHRQYRGSTSMEQQQQEAASPAAGPATSRQTSGRRRGGDGAAGGRGDDEDINGDSAGEEGDGGAGGGDDPGDGGDNETQEELILTATRSKSSIRLTGAKTIRAAFPQQFQQGGGGAVLYARREGGGLEELEVNVYRHVRLGILYISTVRSVINHFGLEGGERLRLTLLDGKVMVERAGEEDMVDPTMVQLTASLVNGKGLQAVRKSTVMHLLGAAVADSPPGVWHFPIHLAGPPGQPLGPLVGSLRSYGSSATTSWRIVGMGPWLHRRNVPPGSALRLAVVQGAAGAAQGAMPASPPYSAPVLTAQLLLSDHANGRLKPAVEEEVQEDKGLETLPQARGEAAAGPLKLPTQAVAAAAPTRLMPAHVPARAAHSTAAATARQDDTTSRPWVEIAELALDLAGAAPQELQQLMGELQRLQTNSSWGLQW